MKTKIFTVYPIVNGFSVDPVYTGTTEQCDTYIKENHLVDVIVLQDD